MPKMSSNREKGDITTIGNSSNDEGDSNTNSKKATGLDKQNNNLVRAARLLYIS